MSEFYDTGEQSEGNFSINFKIVHRYQQKAPFLTDKFKTGKYNQGYFRGGKNNNFNLTMCKV